MGKFSKPSQPALNKLVGGAQAQDTDPTAMKGVRFTLPLDPALTARIDRARAAKGGMSRLAWIRAAITDALDSAGF
jgi:Ribbon-helix-helix protein, copG family